nr:MAG: hypothetical protein [Molluscum contagiosum virus]
MRSTRTTCRRGANQEHTVVGARTEPCCVACVWQQALGAGARTVVCVSRVRGTKYYVVPKRCSVPCVQAPGTGFLDTHCCLVSVVQARPVSCFFGGAGQPEHTQAASVQARGHQVPGANTLVVVSVRACRHLAAGTRFRARARTLVFARRQVVALLRVQARAESLFVPASEERVPTGQHKHNVFVVLHVCGRQAPGVKPPCVSPKDSGLLSRGSQQATVVVCARTHEHECCCVRGDERRAEHREEQQEENNKRARRAHSAPPVRSTVTPSPKSTASSPAAPEPPPLLCCSPRTGPRGPARPFPFPVPFQNKVRLPLGRPLSSIRRRKTLLWLVPRNRSPGPVPKAVTCRGSRPGKATGPPLGVSVCLRSGCSLAFFASDSGTSPLCPQAPTSGSRGPVSPSCGVCAKCLLVSVPEYVHTLPLPPSPSTSSTIGPPLPEVLFKSALALAQLTFVCKTVCNRGVQYPLSQQSSSHTRASRGG